MAINKRKLYMVSNMYPSKKYIRYGIFVKNFETAIASHYVIKKVVLTKHVGIVPKLFGYFTLYFKIVSLVFKAKRNDLIYVHFPLHVAPAVWFVQFFKKRIILNFHGSDLIFDNVFTRVLSLFLIPLIKNNFIVVPSTHYKNKIINSYAKDAKMIFVNPSGGVNTSIFYPKQAKSTNTFSLGFVSNFIESKGWKVFLLAIECINKNNSIPNLKVFMVGDGPDKQAIKKRIQNLNLKYNLIPNVSQHELADLYNKFNLFVFPTDRESLGLVGIESMACGTPVLASRVEGPTGYIDDGVNSYLFEPKNAYDLEKKIIEFYNLSETEKERVRKNGISTAQLFDHNLVNKSIISFLNTI